MNIIVFLIVGLIGGLIAGRLVEGYGFGMVGDVIVGIIGALIGGFIFDAMGYTGYGFWGALAASVVGAFIFLYVASLFPRRPSSAGRI